MNQENKNDAIPSATSTNAGGNVNPNPTVNSEQVLAGSPGIVIAPVSNEPTDASSQDKGRVLGASTVSAQAPQQLTTKAPMVNPAGVVPRVDITSAASPAPPPPPVEEPEQPQPIAPPPKKKSRKAGAFIFLLLLVIAGMGAYIYMDYTKDQARGECSPLVASDNTLRELDINSSIVQELYDKVKTTVQEDVAYHNFDDTLKLYLAFRQIPQSDINDDSNCNLYNESAMTNFSCATATNFTPSSFKEEVLQREVKKLFGESVEIPNQNIVLGNSCYGGYQYIEARGEYVEGYCGQIPTTTYQADKELISASVQGDTITLREQVRYYSAQGIDTSQFQNGVYVYTFKLDNSYHYAYINRTIEEA